VPAGSIRTTPDEEASRGVSLGESRVPTARVGRPGTLLRCLECGRESDQITTGPRAYLLDEDEDERRVLMFCPPCAEREFGPFGWEDRGEPPPSATA
jgi:hypothetical protein